jgi:hypothetical protein
MAAQMMAGFRAMEPPQFYLQRGRLEYSQDIDSDSQDIVQEGGQKDEQQCEIELFLAK